MTDPLLMSSASLYAVKLVACPSDPGRLAGRLEHVLSGRLHDFDDGNALLAFLVREQAQGYSIESGRSTTWRAPATAVPNPHPSFEGRP